MIIHEDIGVFSWIIHEEFNAYETFFRAHLITWIIAGVSLLFLSLLILWKERLSFFQRYPKEFVVDAARSFEQEKG